MPAPANEPQYGSSEPGRKAAPAHRFCQNRVHARSISRSVDLIPKPPIPVSPIVMLSEIGKRIDALLPQTQCQRCGYASCAAYAQAIGEDDVPINQCPPGADAGIHALAALTGKAYAPLNPANGTEAPLRVAFIEEAACIGCTLCLQACPVDAIVGANKRMHTVLPNECSGCELCVPVCPVDCIVLMVPKAPINVAASQNRWRVRQEAHLARYWDESEPEAVENEARATLLARIMEKAKARL
jgi:Na+-translocating ferredoxin:NAD+ oxidoreductase subunit B